MTDEERCVKNEKITDSENDSFYSEENLDHLIKSIQQLNDGKGIAHELIEDAEPKN